MCDIITRLDGLETSLQTNQSSTQSLIDRLSKLEISKAIKSEALPKIQPVIKSQPSEIVNRVVSLENVLSMNQKAAKAICDRIAKLERTKVTN